MPVSAPCSSGVLIIAFSEQDKLGQWTLQPLITVLRPSLQFFRCHPHDLRCWLQALIGMSAAAALRVMSLSSAGSDSRL